MARPINEYYPHPLETSFENWREFKHGTSNHPDYDDDLWQAVYFEHYSKLQTASLRKYLKYNPEKKGGFSFKVRLNLALMDIEERCYALEAFDAARPENQPDAPIV